MCLDFLWCKTCNESRRVAEGGAVIGCRIPVGFRVRVLTPSDYVARNKGNLLAARSALFPFTGLLFIP